MRVFGDKIANVSTTNLNQILLLIRFRMANDLRDTFKSEANELDDNSYSDPWMLDDDVEFIKDRLSWQ